MRLIINENGRLKGEIKIALYGVGIFLTYRIYSKLQLKRALRDTVVEMTYDASSVLLENVNIPILGLGEEQMNKVKTNLLEL